jgi:peptidoglycan/xylan/chitin deacetylase (PgdA/CDA1 family)
VNKTLKAGLVSLVRYTGLGLPLRRRFGGCGIILALHEVQLNPAAELKTGSSPSFLTEILQGLRSEGWEFVSLDEALRRLGDGNETPPFAVVTFDDGYRDTLTNALPVLQRLSIPCTVFVPSGTVTRDLFAWWLALRTLLRSRDEITIECMDRRFTCPDFNRKVAALETIRHWVGRDLRRSHQLAPTFARYRVSLEALAEAYFLDENELRKLAADPLVTVGGHTASHAALPLLDASEARAEMADNRAFLERLLGRRIAHFAYPYGRADAACGGREALLAQEVGFDSAVIGQGGPVFPKHRERLYGLPRIGIRPDETFATLYYRASGMRRSLKESWRRRIEGEPLRSTWNS